MTLEQADRATQEAAILGRVYIRAKGRLVTPVYEVDLQRDLGLAPPTVRKRVMQLVLQKRWLEWVGGGGCEFVAEGMAEFEAELRTWSAGDRPKSLLSDTYQAGVEILKRREWERFRLLELIGALAEKSSYGAVQYEEVRETTELETDEMDQTIDLLAQYGLIREEVGIQLGEAGGNFLQEIQDGLLVLGGLQDPDWQGFKSVIERVWSHNLRSGTLHDAGFVHSQNYQFVRKGDLSFTLPPRAAKVIGLLHRAYRSGIPDVSKDQILNVLGYDHSARVGDAFKPNHRAAWKELVVSPGKGVYRLNL